MLLWAMVEELDKLGLKFTLWDLNLLNLVYTVVFDVETALDNAKLTILERLELQIFFASLQPRWRQIRTFSQITFSGILQKPKSHLYLKCKIV